VRTFWQPSSTLRGSPITRFSLPREVFG
jgi:hypothetical protein